jgi:hypothetical protein
MVRSEFRVYAVLSRLKAGLRTAFTHDIRRDRVVGWVRVPKRNATRLGALLNPRVKVPLAIRRRSRTGGKRNAYAILDAWYNDHSHMSTKIQHNAVIL